MKRACRHDNAHTPRRMRNAMSHQRQPLHNPALPVGLDDLQSDVHAVNREIDRIAYVLHVDLEDHAQVHRIIEGQFPVPEHHGEHLDLLRGLLFLRGRIRQRRLDAGLPDGPSPLAESIYAKLRVHDQQA